MNDKNELSKKFSVNNSLQLCYEGKVMGKSKDISEFKKFDFYREPLGVGANAIVYKAKHKFLNIDQVVKIYFPKRDKNKFSAEKIRKEAIKNSNPTINDIIASIYDAGKLSYPRTIYYSIMENLNNYETLKVYLEKRKLLLNENNLNKEEKKNIIHNSINVSVGILFSILKLHFNNLQHGDLNNGNILIETRVDKTISDNYSTTLGNIDPIKVKLIDLGTSQFKKTNKVISNRRENWFIFSTIKEVLKVYFKDNKSEFQDWLNLEVEYRKKEVNLLNYNKKEIDCYTLASDLLRLIYFVNILSGLKYNEGEHLKLELQDIIEINTIISGGYRIETTDIYNGKAHEAWEMLSKKSEGDLINWKQVMKDLIEGEGLDINNYEIRCKMLSMK